MENDYVTLKDDDNLTFSFPLVPNNPIKEKNTQSQQNATNETTPSQVVIGEEPYRFVIIIIYCTLSFSNAFHWVTFSSCEAQFQETYNLSYFAIDFFSLVYMIIYPFACLPQSYLIDNKSVRLGVSN